MTTYYDEQGNIVENPDLTKGYIYNHYYENGDVRTIYHAFTDEERAEIEAGEEAAGGSAADYEARIKALEEELAATKILLGVE